MHQIYIAQTIQQLFQSGNFFCHDCKVFMNIILLLIKIYEASVKPDFSRRYSSITTTQIRSTCSKSTTEELEKGMKYVQS